MISIKKNKILIRIVSLLFGLVLIAILFSKVNIHQTYSTLLNFNIFLVALYLLLTLFGYVLEPIIQFVFFKPEKISLMVYTIKVLQVKLLSIILPGRSGDIALLFVIGQESKLKLINAYIASKIIVISILLMLLSGLSINQLSDYSVFLIFSGVAIFLLTLLMIVKGIAPAFIIKKMFKGNFNEEKNPINLIDFIRGVAIILFQISIQVVAHYYLLKAGNLYLPLKDVAGIQALVLLAGFIPITPLGLGIIEVSLVYLYSLYGIDESAGITIPIIGRLVQFICLFCFSLTLLWIPIKKPD